MAEPQRYRYYRPVDVDAIAWPLPEVVDPVARAWTVRVPDANQAPAANMKTAEMLVPTAATSAYAARVRLHEMAHVKWSRAAPYPMQSREGLVWLAVEDARIHGKLGQVPALAPVLDTPTPHLAFPYGLDGLQAAFLLPLGLLSARGTPDHATVAPWAGAEGRAIEAHAWEMLSASGTFSKAEAEQCRAYLLEVLPTPPSLPPQHQQQRVGMCGGNHAKPSSRGGEGQGRPFNPKLFQGDWLPNPLDGKGWGRIPARNFGLQTQWGHMTIEEPPRPIKTTMLKGRFAERVARIPSEEGTVPTRWARWPVDRWVFQRKLRRKRQGGGSVLIDGSGSMHFDDNHIKFILEACPVAAVAVYGGNDGDGGILRVLAKNGRRVVPEQVARVGGNNIIDGPALVWLGQQPEPRVWISDEGVTGRLDIGAGNVLQESREIRRHHRIHRTVDVGDAVKIIKTERAWSLQPNPEVE